LIDKNLFIAAETIRVIYKF